MLKRSNYQNWSKIVIKGNQERKSLSLQVSIRLVLILQLMFNTAIYHVLEQEYLAS